MRQQVAELRTDLLMDRVGMCHLALGEEVTDIQFCPDRPTNHFCQLQRGRRLFGADVVNRFYSADVFDSPVNTI